MGLKSFLPEPCLETPLRWAVSPMPSWQRKAGPVSSVEHLVLHVMWFVMASPGQQGDHLIKLMCVMCFQNKVCLGLGLI